MTRPTNHPGTSAGAGKGPSRRDVLRTLGGLTLTAPLTGLGGPFLFARAGDPSKQQAENLALRFAR